MEAAPGSIESLIGKATAYFETSLEFAKLKFTQTYTAAMAVLAFKLISTVLISILFKDLSIGAGLWLGELLGKAYYGFFAVSVLYLLLIMGLHVFLQKWIKRIISQSRPKQLF